MEDKTFYHDRIVKYSFNLPIDLYGKIAVKAKRLNIPKSILVRKILESAVEVERPVTVNQLIAMHQIPNYSTDSIRHNRDPQKKYSGFISGLLRNSFFRGWNVHRNSTSKQEL